MADCIQTDKEIIGCERVGFIASPLVFIEVDLIVEVCADELKGGYLFDLGAN